MPAAEGNIPQAGVTLLGAEGILRRFGSLHALSDVDIDLRRGEVHALVGENGAGKSTLAKILAGSLRAHAGRMIVDGAEYRPRRRADGVAAGIAHVRQQLSLVRGMTLAENLPLGRPHGDLRFSPNSAADELRAHAESLDLALEPSRLVDDLPLADRQRAEVVMALAWGARVIVLDEPSSALGPREVDALLELCRRLRTQGAVVLYISHRLREVEAIADRVTVLRQGRVVAEGLPAGNLGLEDLAALVVGDLPVSHDRRQRPQTGGVRLVARNLHVSPPHTAGLHGVSVEVRSGEILGVVGVAGNGQDELAEVLTGLMRPTRGMVSVDGVEVTGSPVDALAAQVAYLPEERNQGLALGLSVGDNLVAKRPDRDELCRAGFLRPGAIRRFARRLCERFDVQPPDPTRLAGLLSGGNQQKVLAARELEVVPALLVAAGPTKGLDPFATQVMRDRVFSVAEAGGAVIIVSADLDEVLDIAHRIVVLSGGRVSDSFLVEEATSSRLGAAMSGVTHS